MGNGIICPRIEFPTERVSSSSLWVSRWRFKTQMTPFESPLNYSGPLWLHWRNIQLFISEIEITSVVSVEKTADFITYRESATKSSGRKWWKCLITVSWKMYPNNYCHKRFTLYLLYLLTIMLLDLNKCLRCWPIFDSIQRPETTLASMSIDTKTSWVH